MAKVAEVVVSVRDLASVKLLFISLRMLLDDMRVEANPRAKDLLAILDRFDTTMSEGGPDDGAKK